MHAVRTSISWTKGALLACLVLLSLLMAQCSGEGREKSQYLSETELQEGDIIFQESSSPQSLAIQIATGSRYSHCGIIFSRDGRFYVYEAIQKVSWTPVEDWIRRGVDAHYVLMRLKNREYLLDQPTITAMKKVGQSFAGKKYDLLFQWSDDTLYCSELVWKIYQRGAGISLVPLHKFSDYSLNSEVVRKIIKKRYGDTLPQEEKVVAPSDLLVSPLLERVAGN